MPNKPPVVKDGNSFCPDCGAEVFPTEQGDEIGGKIVDFSCTECDWEYYP